MRDKKTTEKSVVFLSEYGAQPVCLLGVELHMRLSHLT